MSKKKEISIIYLTFNGLSNHLEESLDGVLNQRTQHTYEVIVIDSGSTDGTIKFIEKQPLLKLYKIPNSDFNHGKTRQKGVELSQGEYIVFLTQDAIPANNQWLNNLITGFKDPGVVGVCSKILPREDAYILKKIETNNDLSGRSKKIIAEVKDQKYFEKLSFCNKRSGYYFFHDISSCIRRDFLMQNNFPDVEFAEDVEFAKMALKKGKKIVFDPNSVVYHSHDYTIKKTYQRNYIDSKYHKDFFKIKNVPTLRRAVLNTGGLFLRDLKQIFKYKVSILEKTGAIFYSPVIHFAEQLGQYRGTQSR